MENIYSLFVMKYLNVSKFLILRIFLVKNSHRVPCCRLNVSAYILKCDFVSHILLKNELKRCYSVLTRQCFEMASALKSVNLGRFETFLARVLARRTVLQFRCFSIHVKMTLSVLVRYFAKK